MYSSLVNYPQIKAPPAAQFKDFSSSNQIWRHFLRCDDWAMCKKEDCEIKLHNKGSTGSLHKHLKIHGINVEKRKSNSGVDDPHKKVTIISDYMQRVDSTPVVISRLVARDGIPMGTLVTSQDMRRFFFKGWSETVQVPKFNPDCNYGVLQQDCIGIYRGDESKFG